MPTEEINSRLEKLIVEGEFPLLHKLSRTTSKEEVYSELHSLFNKVAASIKEDERTLRRAERHSFKALCTLISDGHEEKSLLSNISKTGLRAKVSEQTYVPIAPNKKLQIRLRVLRDDSRTEATVSAKLVRILEPKGGFLELCFDFVELGSYEEQVIAKFIKVYSE